MKNTTSNSKEINLRFFNKLVYSLSILLFFSLFLSCTKENNVIPDIKSDQALNLEKAISASNLDNEKQLKNVWRLIVGFASDGSGINTVAYDELKSYVISYERIIGKPIAYKIVNTGWEGEREVRFKLQELNNDRQFEFVRGVKLLLRYYPTVQIFENAYRPQTNTNISSPEIIQYLD